MKSLKRKNKEKRAADLLFVRTNNRQNADSNSFPQPEKIINGHNQC